MENLVYLPVEKIHLKDLYDWSIPVQRCKSTKVALSPVGSPASSPRKSGVKVDLENGKGTGSLVKTNEHDIALFRYKTTVFAVKEECPHAGGPLHLGEIEDLGDELLCVRCPWHGWRISLHDGHVTLPKGHNFQSTVVYPVKITQEGQISIGFRGLDSKYFKVDEILFVFKQCTEIFWSRRTICLIFMPPTQDNDKSQCKSIHI
ncbi:uncharacterized protein LOC128229709 isoform X1 [Mya arenaria]|uniref:uncharacterized protein LOC128229709 isoform X1 n=1 Tax=Mya arenaria TaxID=6604 RepID=UPI0022E682CA|nr:uncharacterized protein LOC128229709 isoform X1 [Mya arenaria]